MEEVTFVRQMAGIRMAAAIIIAGTA